MQPHTSRTAVVVLVALGVGAGAGAEDAAVTKVAAAEPAAASFEKQVAELHEKSSRELEAVLRAVSESGRLRKHRPEGPAEDDDAAQQKYRGDVTAWLAKVDALREQMETRRTEVESLSTQMRVLRDTTDDEAERRKVADLQVGIANGRRVLRRSTWALERARTRAARSISSTEE